MPLKKKQTTCEINIRKTLRQFSDVCYRITAPLQHNNPVILMTHFPLSGFKLDTGKVL